MTTWFIIIIIIIIKINIIVVIIINKLQTRMSLRITSTYYTELCAFETIAKYCLNWLK